MSIQVAVTSWGGDCGPRPQSTSAPGGGTFRISQDGDQLTFHLRQQRTTRGCWSENRAVRRVSSTHQGSTWRIVCRTPPEDSRGETGTYTIQAIGNDQLSFRDVSAYDWQLNESRCVATITTTQSFTRVSGGTATTTPEPPGEEPRPACTPGAPARIVLRPATAQIAPDAEQCFTTRVVDAQGCAVRSQRVDLSLASGAGRLEGRCYTASAADGEATIRARAGELTSEARETVSSMDLSDLIARRSETGSVGSGVANEEDASADTAARVRAHSEESIGLLWPLVALGVALVLVIGGAIALSRRRKPAKRSIAGLPGVEIPEPELRRASTPPPPAPPSEPPAQPAPEGPREDLICPACRRGYPPGTAQCAADGTALVPYSEFKSARGREHVCPTCGERYPETVRFCGKDGSTLEPG